MQYKTRGTCSQLINLELDGDVIKSVEFIGGCDGQPARHLKTGNRHEGRRCHQASGRNPVRVQANILSGPARKSTSSGIGTVSIHKYV